MLAYSSIANAGYLLSACSAINAAGAVRHDVLPAGVRLHGDRRVRRGDAGARRRRRGDPPVPVGRAGRRSPLFAGSLTFLLLALRRHPARPAASPASSRCSPRPSSDGMTSLVIVGRRDQRGGRVPLPAGRRADVLLRAGRRRPDGRVPGPLTTAADHHCGRRWSTAAARRRADASSSDVADGVPLRRPMTVASQLDPGRGPGVDSAIRTSPRPSGRRPGPRRGPAAPRGAQRRPVRHRGRAAPHRGRRQAVPAAAGAAGRPVRRPGAPRSSTRGRGRAS